MHYSLCWTPFFQKFKLPFMLYGLRGSDVDDSISTEDIHLTNVEPILLENLENVHEAHKQHSLLRLRSLSIWGRTIISTMYIKFSGASNLPGNPCFVHFSTWDVTKNGHALRFVNCFWVAKADNRTKKPIGKSCMQKQRQMHNEIRDFSIPNLAIKPPRSSNTTDTSEGSCKGILEMESAFFP